VLSAVQTYVGTNECGLGWHVDGWRSWNLAQKLLSKLDNAVVVNT
jgi:hypothetical protein